MRAFRLLNCAVTRLLKYLLKYSQNFWLGKIQNENYGNDFTTIHRSFKFIFYDAFQHQSVFILNQTFE